MDIGSLLLIVKEIAKKETDAGGKQALDGWWVPDRWFLETGNRQPLLRCVNDHVSEFGIQTEEDGIICEVCMGKCVWTFPEDSDGEIERPTK